MKQVLEFEFGFLEDLWSNNLELKGCFERHVLLRFDWWKMFDGTLKTKDFSVGFKPK